MGEIGTPALPTDPIAQNRSAYDQIASRFAERNAGMLPFIIEAAARMLEAIRQTANPYLPVLDLGCGTGRDMAWLEAQSLTVVGVDLSTGMLTEARTRVRGPLCQLDMLCLPFAGGSFTAVWCQAALLHLPKAKAPAALSEAYRVLSPGGVLHVSVQKGGSEGFETRPYEPVARYYAHYQADEFRTLIQSAGFEILYQAEAEARRTWLWVSVRKRT